MPDREAIGAHAHTGGAEPIPAAAPDSGLDVPAGAPHEPAVIVHGQLGLERGSAAPIARLRPPSDKEMGRLLDLTREHTRRVLAEKVINIFGIVVLSAMGLVATEHLAVAEAATLITATGVGGAVPIVLAHYFPKSRSEQEHGRRSKARSSRVQPGTRSAESL